MALEVVEADGLATVQDLGRAKWMRFGVPHSGPMDGFAFRAANALAGNPADSAALEIGAGDIVLRATQDCVIAVTGAGFRLSVYIWDFHLWDSIFVRQGWMIRLTKTAGGTWAYLAACGGIQTEPVLGSRATYLRGRLGGLDGRRLQPGDLLQTASSAGSLEHLAGRTLAPHRRPIYSAAPVVEVIPGPQIDRFTGASMETFLASEYAVSFLSDRMGYRLEGAQLTHQGSPDLLSEGMAPGAVQVPAGGQPIVMMADSPTTGGYPKIAAVVSADLHLLAQCPPGSGRVRFRETTVESAQKRFRAQMEGLKNGIIDAEQTGQWG